MCGKMISVRNRQIHMGVRAKAGALFVAKTRCYSGQVRQYQMQIQRNGAVQQQTVNHLPRALHLFRTKIPSQQ